ncbi:hypothetical protein GOP47_0024162 [Adiantum capillus-veneris]|uniref:Uncharacterized protein n=1 Tax=Adiantum capillus-veneris TaxID=13818 RepID=A0A9D4Z5V4_ADICA|nr:hypothetical protein GOP47_0024162 [Adiantum capillus-veneris]
MASSTSSPPAAIKSGNDQNNIPDDERIKPMILAFKEKINLNSLVISEPAYHQGAINSKINEPPMKEDDQKGMKRRETYQSQDQAEEDQLWPKTTELDDRPPSPSSQHAAIKQVISESTYLSSKYQQKKLDDDQSSSAVIDECSKPTTQIISKPAYQSSKQAQPEQVSWPSSPDRDLSKLGTVKAKQHMIREVTYQQSSKAMSDVLSLNSSFPLISSDPSQPRAHMIRDSDNPISPTHESQAAMRENYRNNAQGRLSSVVEESESFSRREFGDDMLNYMSTFSSATHASNLSSLRAHDSAFDYKNYSYRHNNYHQFAYNLSTSHEPGKGNFVNSKSAPAGTATRTGSAFGLFRRGTSERSGLRLGRRTVYRPHKPRRPKTLAKTLLWPLVKIRNGYVGCMMGLEGTGDLTAMAQGGSYASTARYFADVPLSKSDSRSYG